MSVWSGKGKIQQPEVHPLAGLLAAVFIIYADLFVRLVVRVDLKIGILTSLMGGPFFLYLLLKYRKRFEYL